MCSMQFVTRRDPDPISTVGYILDLMAHRKAYSTVPYPR